MVSSKNKFSIISELHLQSACITSNGLKAFEMIDPTKIDLQILDLGYNDLGNDAAQYLQFVIPSIVSLNLSSTKLGQRGCLELAKSFNIFTEETGF